MVQRESSTELFNDALGNSTFEIRRKDAFEVKLKMSRLRLMLIANFNFLT